MKIYNEAKTKELKEYDLTKGYIVEDKITHHIPEVKAVEKKSHYETIKEYPNGGKDVREVIDVKPVAFVPAHDEVETIGVYKLFTNKEIIENIKKHLRAIRASECFSVINRGLLWHETLTEEQSKELKNWYIEWLHVTDKVSADTKLEQIKPVAPKWLK